MINIGKILKRSWLILWNYRILWVFGFLLALTTGGGGGGNSGGRSQATQNNPGGFSGVLPENTPQWMRQLGRWFVENVQPLYTHPEQHIGTFLTIGLIIFLIVLVFSLLTALVRYPTETAVIRMVNEYENSGNKVGFRQGWKLGWSRVAFRLWVIDLVLCIPALVFMLLIGATGLILLFTFSSAFKLISAIGVVAAIGIGFLSIFILIVVAVVLGLLRNFFVRAAALDGKGVVESLRSGWAMFIRNWKSAGVMWLVMVGIGIGYGIFGIVVFFLLIPAYLVLLLPAAFVAALPALLGFGFSSVFVSGPLAWIIAALFAAPFFFITLFAPLILINGWYKIYESNIWTLTYREIKAIESLATRDLPVSALPADVPPAV